MPSSSKTNYLQLNYWSAGDKPKMADFNNDNQRLLVQVESFGAGYDSIYQCMERGREFLPAHMEVIFEYGGPDWSQWEEDTGTWEAFDAADLTWQQRDRWRAATVSPSGVPPVSRPTRPLWGLNPLKGESHCLEF